MLLNKKPYDVKVLLSIACDPVLGEQDTDKTVAAMKKVDFIAASDFFISPAANLADILLPPATYLERDEIHTSRYTGFYCAGEKAIEPVGECRLNPSLLP